jgi:low affinity Fe/Cu permease
MVSDDQEGLQKIQLVKKAGRLSFEVKLTFIVSVVLFFPVALCILLHSKPTVHYLFGNWVLYAVIAVAAWVLLCHFLIVSGVLRHSLAPIFVVILPCAFLACVCQIQEWQFSAQGVALQSTDCASFAMKAQLEDAWWAAHDFYTNCTGNLVQLTGAPMDETLLVTSFKSCPGYQQAEGQYKRQWWYLEHLESYYRCGGWCTPQKPLWVHQAGMPDGCSDVVARALSGNISLLGLQITVYSGVLLLCASIVLLTNPQWIAELK